MEEGVFPHMRSLGDPFALEEERRLCYVGVTRARRHLSVSHAWTRSLFGSTTHGIPSRFLAELPDGLLDDVAPPVWRTSRGESMAASTTRATAARRSDGRAAAPRRLDGGRAPRPRTRRRGGPRALGTRHGARVEGSGAQTRGRVRFDAVGEKQLLFAMAPLQRPES